MWLHIRSKTTNKKYKYTEVMIDATKIIALDILEASNYPIFGLKIMTNKQNYIENYDSLIDAKSRMIDVMEYVSLCKRASIHSMDAIRLMVKEYDYFSIDEEHECQSCEKEHSSDVNQDTFFKIMAEIDGERI